MTTPILLIPGLNATAEVFENQLPALWSTGPVTIASTLVGTSMAEIAAAILADAPPRFALVGFSMGGYIAFELLRQAPERVLALALLDTSARSDTPEGADKRKSAIALTEQGKFAQVVSQGFANTVHPDHAGDEGLRALHTRMATAIGPAIYVQQQKATMARPDSRPDLPNIAVPTLVVVGDSDNITVPDMAKEMAAAIPGAELRIIPRAGHLALVEQHKSVTEALVGWLRPL